MMESALWVLVLFGFMASVATFVFFVGGAFVAWIADMQRERWSDE